MSSLLASTRAVSTPAICRLISRLGLAAIVGLGGLALTSAEVSADYPEPSLAPKAWEFDFTWRKPQRVVLEEPDGERRAYWYMPYTVVNDTEQERFFLPDIVMVTQTGELLAADNNIPAGAFNAIKNRTPSLPIVQPREVSGRLLIGEDRARSSVAIWREPMTEMGTFQIFVGGLSGEIQRLQDRNNKDLLDGDGNPILVRKTKHLVFRVSGDDVDTGESDNVQVERDRWVMR